MRICAIAEEAAIRDIECVLVGSVEGIPWLSEFVRGLGYLHFQTPGDYTTKTPDEILIIDSYTIQPGDPFIISNSWVKQILIADKQTPVHQVDLTIHPGFNGSWYVGDLSKFVYGSEFIPIRKSIRRVNTLETNKISKIVISGGGTDVQRFCPEIAGVLAKIGGFTSAVFFSQEKQEIEYLDSRFSVREFGKDLDYEIMTADLVLSTASTTSFEVLARGIPLGIVCGVENQLDNYETLGKRDVAAAIGERWKHNSWDFDVQLLETLIENAEFRKQLVKNAQGLIDLNGAERIIEKITFC